MNRIHRFLDWADTRFGVPTFAFESAARLALESVLLLACALPVITDWRSAVAQSLGVALRLYQAETGRERASIMSRAKESGLVVEPDLSAAKRAKLAELAARDQVITWIWPVLTTVISAAYARTLNTALIVSMIGLVATLVRAAFDRRWLPAWRASRVAWKRERARDEFVLTCRFLSFLTFYHVVTIDNHMSTTRRNQTSDDFLAVYHGQWDVVGGAPLKFVGIERAGAAPAAKTCKATNAAPRALPKPGFDARAHQEAYAAEMAKYGITVPVI